MIRFIFLVILLVIAYRVGRFVGQIWAMGKIGEKQKEKEESSGKVAEFEACPHCGAFRARGDTSCCDQKSGERS